MHTILVISSGVVVLLLCVLFCRGRYGAGATSMVKAAKLFIPLWFVLALINMMVGVMSAGYTVAEELPIFLLVFGLPAALAAVIWQKYRQK